MTRARAFLHPACLRRGNSRNSLPCPGSEVAACWKQVINDWSQDGSIDGAYSAKCIEEALDRCPRTSAPTATSRQAKAARLAAGRALQSSGGAARQRRRERERGRGGAHQAAGAGDRPEGRDADPVRARDERQQRGLRAPAAPHPPGPCRRPDRRRSTRIRRPQAARTARAATSPFRLRSVRRLLIWLVRLGATSATKASESTMYD